MGDTVLWYAWLVLFALKESHSIWRKRRGDVNAKTLTDIVTGWRDFRVRSLDIGRYGLAAGMLWLVGHFFGAW